MIDITLHTLLKKWWRSDTMWTHPLFQKKIFKRIPATFDIQALMKSQYWPRAKLELLTRARLGELARHASQLPYWRDRFNEAGIDPTTRTEETWSQIPVTSKNDLKSSPISDYTRPESSRMHWRDHTSGSTGQPFQFYHDLHHELRMFAVCERMYRTAGRGARPHLITMRARRFRGMILANATFFYLKGGTSVVHRINALIETISKHPNGVLLHGFASSLVFLARLLGERGSPLLPIRGVIVSAEGLSDAGRALLVHAFKAPVCMSYATRELGFLAFECEHGRMHINEESAYIEIADAQGVPQKHGTEGRIVVTTFDNKVMPFIRYNTGDLGIIDASPCPCDRTLNTISVRGRVTQTIELPENRTVPLLDVSAAFDRFFRQVRQYQIRQTGPLSFVVAIVPGSDFESIKPILEGVLVRLMHPSVHIEWETASHIPEGPGGKALYFSKTY